MAEESDEELDYVEEDFNEEDGGDDEEIDDNYGLETSLKAEALEYAQNIQKRGVIYISRIPPFMKPNKVRSCFEVYGEVTRLYLGLKCLSSAVFVTFVDLMFCAHFVFSRGRCCKAKATENEWR